jgi:hypothetical protein
MARQRINPDPAPERIIRPVASPVDTYVRPDVRSFMSVAEAFGDMVPGLQKLGNSIIDSIAKRETVEGAIEGRNEAFKPASEAKQSRVAQQIERAGGVSPWRAQAHLQSLGATAAQQGYGAELDKNFEEWTNPQNADGSPRDPSYISGKMKETWDSFSKGLPNSYYARASAEEVRAQMDSRFINQANAKVAEKIKKQHVEQVANEIIGVMNGWDSADDVLASGGEFAKATQRYFEVTGEAPDKVAIKALSEWAKMEAANDNGADPSTVRAILANALESGIGGRQFGEAAKLELNKAINDVDDIIEQNERGSREKQASLKEQLRNGLSTAMREKFANDGALWPPSMDKDEAQKLLQRYGASPEMLGPVLSDMQNFRHAILTPTPLGDRELENLRLNLRTKSFKEAEQFLSDLVLNGGISNDQRNSLLSELVSRSASSSEAAEKIAKSETFWLGPVGLTGKAQEGLSSDWYARRMPEILSEAQEEAEGMYADWYNSPEAANIRSLSPEERDRALVTKWRAIHKEVQGKIRERYGEEFKDADRSRSDSLDKVTDANWMTSRLVNAGLAEASDGNDPAAETRMKTALQELITGATNEVVEGYTGLNSGLAEFMRTEGNNKIDRLVRSRRADFKYLSEFFDGDEENVAAAFQAPKRGLRVTSPQGVMLDQSEQLQSLEVPGLANASWGIFMSMGRAKAAMDDVVKGSEDVRTGAISPEVFQQRKKNLIDQLVWIRDGSYLNYLNSQGSFEVIIDYRMGPDGIVAATGMSKTYDVQAKATNMYLASVLMTGLTLDELKAGKTKEGMTLKPVNYDYNQQLFFASPEDYEAAKTDGRMQAAYDTLLQGGYIAEDFGVFAKKQGILVYARHPSKTKAPTNQ